MHGCIWIRTRLADEWDKSGEGWCAVSSATKRRDAKKKKKVSPPVLTVPTGL
jgi:hypothetical protein